MVAESVHGGLFQGGLEMKPFALSLSVTVAVILALMVSPGVSAKKKKQPPEETFDGLVRVEQSEVALAYRKPDADFTAYKKIVLLPVHVAFKKDWEREFHMRVPKSEQERMKSDLAEEFRKIFVEELEAKGGYPIVDEAGEDVMVIRPALVDIYVEAPDARSMTARSRTYVVSSGEATLYGEIFDSVSGEILGRVIDKKIGTRGGGWTYRASAATNWGDAQRALQEWASILRQRLDEIHGKSAE
jgi:hypothetical protein